jgi:hypothetical protein
MISTLKKENQGALSQRQGQSVEEIPYVNSIFQQPWWLDAIVPDQWDEITVVRGKKIVVRMPYMLKKRYGLTYLLNPPLTQTLGPWFLQSNAKYAKQLSQQKKLLNELIEKLPRFDLFSLTFSPLVTNVLPFFWAGFNYTTLYTYRLEDLTDLDRIWRGFRENIKTDIRKAKKKLCIRSDLSLEKFIEIYSLTFKRQGRSSPRTEELLYRLDNACLQHDARRIFFAQDVNNRIHGVLYFIWDKHTGYYLMSGGNPALRNSGAGSLLVWEAIQFASRVTKVFDYEGSMIEPVERFFRAFGARQVPYFKVRKLSRRMQALNCCRDLIKIALFK